MSALLCCNITLPWQPLVWVTFWLCRYTSMTVSIHICIQFCMQYINKGCFCCVIQYDPTVCTFVLLEYKGMYCRVILYQVIVSIIEYYSYTVDVHMQQLFIPTVCTTCPYFNKLINRLTKVLLSEV